MFCSNNLTMQLAVPNETIPTWRRALLRKMVNGPPESPPHPERPLMVAEQMLLAITWLPQLVWQAALVMVLWLMKRSWLDVAPAENYYFNKFAYKALKKLNILSVCPHPAKEEATPAKSSLNSPPLGKRKS